MCEAPQCLSVYVHTHSCRGRKLCERPATGLPLGVNGHVQTEKEPGPRLAHGPGSRHSSRAFPQAVTTMKTSLWSPVHTGHNPAQPAAAVLRPLPSAPPTSVLPVRSSGHIPPPPGSLPRWNHGGIPRAPQCLALVALALSAVRWHHCCWCRCLSPPVAQGPRRTAVTSCLALWLPGPLLPHGPSYRVGAHSPPVGLQRVQSAVPVEAGAEEISGLSPS